jgi:hypothetical protein
MASSSVERRVATRDYFEMAETSRPIKLAWYRRYGVRECWIADPHLRTST